jgi:hypothetical protein
VLRFVVVLGAVAVVAAGCGVRNNKPFTAAGTGPCLTDKGFRKVTTGSDPAKVGFVAATAENGGLRAVSPKGNTLTIAFAADEESVQSTEQAVKRFAPASIRPHIGDIMSASRNAVLVWTVTPDPGEADTANRCLKP